MKTEFNFINMTNGIEVLKTARLENVRFLRLQSTHLEQHRFDDFFKDLSPDFMIALALGYKVVIHDASVRTVSRVVWFGVPLIKHVIDARWYYKKDNPNYTHIKKGCLVHSAVGNKLDVSRYFRHIARNLNRRTKRRIDYYKKFHREGLVNIVGTGFKLKKEHHPYYNAGILQTYDNFAPSGAWKFWRRMM